jgi:16S rRNA (guanine527-N7)-methyltransferase
VDRPRVPLPTRVQDLPPLPSAYGDVVDAGLEAMRMELAPAARAAIDDHVRLLLAWTAAINLTAIREPERVAQLHVLDSLAAVPLLRDLGVTACLDVGSGGGYPGIPVAAALPAARALLVDSVAKKTRFLGAVVEAVGIAARVDVVTARAEQLARMRAHRDAWPAVLARAVSSLGELIEVGLPLVAPGGVLVAWKREPLAEELAAAAGALRALDATAEVVQSGVPGLEHHRLVVVRKGSPSDAAFPRDPTDRRRQPL